MINKKLLKTLVKQGFFLLFKSIYIIKYCVMKSNKDIYRLINEELSKSEVASLIQSKIDSNMSSKDFEKKDKEISASVLDELFKILWQRNSFWKNSVKN